MNKSNKDIKVVVGISGGVDSAVAAFLLKEAGYNVQGIFMQNWDSFVNNEDYDNKKDKCDAQYEYEDAQAVCDYLGIPLERINFVKEYWDDVFQTFLQEYEKARTPNPDVLCNRYIKFGQLLKYALANYDCDFIATGHYARVIHFPDHSELHTCLDSNKDQTYFLCELSQSQLSKTLFPLSHLTKPEVREIAKAIGLPVHNKKDSSGICFIGERNFKNFLSNYIKNKEGDIIDITTNKVLGKHQGVMFYTIGQNNNLNLSGLKEKYFVCKKDATKNILYVVRNSFKEDYLTSHQCEVHNFHWINYPKKLNNLQVRFRHRQKLINCSILIDNGKVIIDYPEGSLSVTEGQYAVLYEGTNCLGGGPVDLIRKI